MCGVLTIGCNFLWIANVHKYYIDHHPIKKKFRKNYTKRTISATNRGMTPENECSKILKSMVIINIKFDENQQLFFICFSLPLVLKRIPYCNSSQADHFQRINITLPTAVDYFLQFIKST